MNFGTNLYWINLILLLFFFTILQFFAPISVQKMKLKSLKKTDEVIENTLKLLAEQLSDRMERKDKKDRKCRKGRKDRKGLNEMENLRFRRRT